MTSKCVGKPKAGCQIGTIRTGAQYPDRNICPFILDVAPFSVSVFCWLLGLTSRHFFLNIMNHLNPVCPDGCCSQVICTGSPAKTEVDSTRIHLCQSSELLDDY